jgi:hypothetical protein
MPDQSLLLLAQDVRGKTLRILDGITEQQARFVPKGLNNSILWHAGHSLVVVEHLGLEPSTGKPPAYPKDWFDKFSWTSKPATVTSWPTLAQVKEQLVSQNERLSAVLKNLSEDQLTKPFGEPARQHDVRWAIIHGLHDEAGHQGEMWHLKKLQTTAG